MKMAKFLFFLHLYIASIGSSNAIDIIAHRGASGYLPENTKEAAVMAFMQGADYIEQDLVITRDDKLVVLHDVYLENTTNVEEIYPQRNRNDGKYYVIDFTLAELRALSMHERKDDRSEQVYASRYSGSAHFAISTFDEHVELIRELNRQLNRDTGIYPEIKSPQWHKEQGKDITLAFANKIKALGLNNKTSNVFVQSFDPVALKRLNNQLGIDVNLIQLMGENSWSISSADYTFLKSDEGLKDIANYAQGIGPWIPQVLDVNTTSKTIEITDRLTGLISRAKQKGLLVHPYTLRADVNNAASLDTKAIFEILKEQGIDGIFTDQIMPYMQIK